MIDQVKEEAQRDNYNKVSNVRSIGSIDLLILFVLLIFFASQVITKQKQSTRATYNLTSHCRIPICMHKHTHT